VVADAEKSENGISSANVALRQRAGSGRASLAGQNGWNIEKSAPSGDNSAYAHQPSQDASTLHLRVFCWWKAWKQTGNRWRPLDVLTAVLAYVRAVSLMAAIMAWHP